MAWQVGNKHRDLSIQLVPGSIIVATTKCVFLVNLMCIFLFLELKLFLKDSLTDMDLMPSLCIFFKVLMI